MSGERTITEAVSRYIEVLNGADPERLRDILTDDIVDDAMICGDPGVDGVIDRVRLYRAGLPDAVTVLVSVAPSEGGATIEWITAATGLDGSSERARYRYRAAIAMRGARIQSHQVLSVEPAD